ncbi:ABC transporter ATP-binding protein [Cohnella kolymensis]|uniref:ABC transporter ATP-binding protein n=2 Tax=Cohnella kolymensis TaxID=1590652 RepID=A0ABR5A5G1_9BACL|nr:ABC transporter ATP-binding protein [Cohnella kolymensis]
MSLSESGKCIEVKQVTKAFGKKVVLNDVSLDVKRGEIFGLLGPSGSGKTTLVRLITGLDEPGSGSISVLGEQMPKLGILSRIGYMAQSDALYGELSAMENLQFFSSLYGLRGHLLKERIGEAAELVKLTDDLKKPVHEFSGGMKRRLSLATALTHHPEVLILDEPTVGIDPVLRKSVWKELDVLREKGVTILVTTHVMDEAEKCDRLAMIRDGKVIALGTPAQLKMDSGSETMEDAFVAYGGGQA